jgi:hypothetical protein
MDAQKGALAPEREQGPFSPGQLKLLKAAIAVMSAILVVGFAVVAGRIAYLASQSGRQALPAPAPQAQLDLPAGAQVRGMSMSGERLAVHYEAPSGAGIAILDLVTGRSVTHINVVPRDRH